MSDKFELISKYLIRELLEDKNLYILVLDAWECYFFGEYKNSFDTETKSRLINTGISEANTISLAAGLAQSSKKVVILGLASFLTGRAFEQIKLDICYSNCNVKIIGIHGGVVGPRNAGYSHWAIEDIALMNSLPNINIVDIAPADCEFYNLMKSCFQLSGPVYIRIDCPYERHLDLNYKVKFGKISKVKSGKEIAIITTGSMLIEAIKFRKNLAKISVLPSIYSCHTLKPFDTKTIKKIIKDNKAIAVFEEHVKGGLSSLVAEEIAKNKKSIKFYPVRITNETYNFVALTKENVFKHLYDFDKLYNELGNLKSNMIFRRKISNTGGLLTIEHRFMNIPLYKLQERKIIKRGKSKYRTFLFNKIRVF